MADVKVTGLSQTLSALRAIEPEMTKGFRKELNESVAIIRTTARGFVPTGTPMSGWEQNLQSKGRWKDRAYDLATMKRGIQSRRDFDRRNPKGTAIGYSVENKSAPGMIYELAGTKSSGEGAGVKFIENIAATGLRTPLRRLVVQAGIEKGDEVRIRMNRTITKAEQLIQRRLNKWA